MSPAAAILAAANHYHPCKVFTVVGHQTWTTCDPAGRRGRGSCGAARGAAAGGAQIPRQPVCRGGPRPRQSVGGPAAARTVRSHLRAQVPYLDASFLLRIQSRKMVSTGDIKMAALKGTIIAVSMKPAKRFFRMPLGNCEAEAHEKLLGPHLAHVTGVVGVWLVSIA